MKIDDYMDARVFERVYSKSNRIKESKNKVWSSNNDKIHVWLDTRQDGETVLYFKHNDSKSRTGIRIDEAEAISHAIAYFKNCGVL